MIIAFFLFNLVTLYSSPGLLLSSAASSFTMLRLSARGARKVFYVKPYRLSCLSTAGNNESPTTAVRQNTAVDQSSLWKYLNSMGLEGFADESQCVMRQFAHGNTLMGDLVHILCSSYLCTYIHVYIIISCICTGQSNPTFMVTLYRSQATSW